jgi:hypothetical protein
MADSMAAPRMMPSRPALCQKWDESMMCRLREVQFAPFPSPFNQAEP